MFFSDKKNVKKIKLNGYKYSIKKLNIFDFLELSTGQSFKTYALSDQKRIEEQLTKYNPTTYEDLRRSLDSVFEKCLIKPKPTKEVLDGLWINMKEAIDLYQHIQAFCMGIEIEDLKKSSPSI